MSDNLDELKALMKAATPAVDAETKAAHLQLARKNFADFQGSRKGARPKSDRLLVGLWTGVKKMIGTLSVRGGLVATTAIVAVCFVALTPGGRDLLVPNGLPKIGSSPHELPEPQVIGDTAGVRDDGLARLTTSTGIDADREEYDAAQPETELKPNVLADAQGQLRSLAPASPLPKAARRAVGDRATGVTLGLSLSAQDPATILPEANTEVFSNDDSNPLKVTAEEPVSTFSIDVDTASYAVIRNSLSAGVFPAQQAVRIEEMINYFPYDYPSPTSDAAFTPTVSVSPTPWNAGTRLVHIGIQGSVLDLEARPPLNLVFLIDTSGSMNQANKLHLLKQSFALMLGQLRPEDQVAIVAYAGSAGQVLEPTPARDRATILEALNRLDAGGSTAGQQGLQLAYSVAEGMSDDGEISRVILATDGDFNVGLSDPGALEDFIGQKRESGTYLSVLGFGRGNLDDATMQALAQNGNGTAAYIDTLSEAQKVLVDQLSGALFPIANDVKIQVEFNPSQIAEYRLIGYETRELRREDFSNDKVDAGDIGAGHQVTALYEVTPVGSDAQLTEPLRYGQVETPAAQSDELGFLRLRYKQPGVQASKLIEMPITADLPPQADAGFSIAIAGFGQLLRGSDYLGDWSWGDAIALANRNKGDDPFGYRAEAVQLMRLAESLSAQ